MKISERFQDRAKEAGLTAELVQRVVVLFYEKIAITCWDRYSKRQSVPTGMPT
jgi:hypothetical protein